MGDYSPSQKDIEAQRWCLKNDIRIAPFAHDNSHWWIDVMIGKKSKRSPNYFTKGLVWQKIFDYYKYYYDKHEEKKEKN